MEPQWTEDQRTETFREFVADQMKSQTKSLDTMRSLAILWTVFVGLGLVFLVIGTFAG